MIFEMNLSPVPFNEIITRRKDVEMRLLTEERKKIKIGDEIVFTNTSTHKKIKAVVTNLRTFKTFKELYMKYPKSRLGYMDNEVADYKDMYQYYSEENISRFGAIAIEIKLCDDFTY